MLDIRGPTVAGQMLLLDREGNCVATVKHQPHDPQQSIRLARLFARAAEMRDALAMIGHQLSQDDDGTRYRDLLKLIDETLHLIDIPGRTRSEPPTTPTTTPPTAVAVPSPAPPGPRSVTAFLQPQGES